MEICGLLTVLDTSLERAMLDMKLQKQKICECFIISARYCNKVILCCHPASAYPHKKCIILSLFEKKKKKKKEKMS